MGTSTSIMREQELNEFMKLRSPNEIALNELPLPADDRSVTDKKGFVVFGILLLVLVPFLIYGLVKSDIRISRNGFDSCGNICGVTNKKIEGIACSGKDYTNKPYRITNITTDEVICTDHCPLDYKPASDNVCYPDLDDVTVSDTDLLSEALKLWWKYLVIAIITSVISYITLLLFRWFPSFIVWGLTILSLVVSLALTGFFWYSFSQTNRQKEGLDKQVYLLLALILTIFTTSIIIVFLIIRKKISLVILLYKETTKALFAMPFLIFMPIIILFFQIVVLTLLLLTSTYLVTAQELAKNKDDNYYHFYRPGIIAFTLFFNVVVATWALQFFSGCQYMIISGSIVQWYFKKEHSIATSCTNTMKYHLGTISLGSFVIVSVALIKFMIRSLVANSKLRWCFDCICGNIEAFLIMLSKIAYVETAIYGQSFFRSGKRAAKLIITNLQNVIAVNWVADFVLTITRFLLLACSTTIAYYIFLNDAETWFHTLLCFFLNLFVIIIIFNLFETVVDVLLICFCEDVASNDGSQSKPFHMSKDLMQFVEKTNEVYKDRK